MILLVVTLAVAGDPAVCNQGGLGYIGPGKEAHGEDVLDWKMSSGIYDGILNTLFGFFPFL